MATLGVLKQPRSVTRAVSLSAFALWPLPSREWSGRGSRPLPTRPWAVQGEEGGRGLGAAPVRNLRARRAVAVWIQSPSDTIVFADSRDDLDYVVRFDPAGTVYAPDYRHSVKALFGIFDGHVTRYDPLEGVVQARWDCQ
jgi:hypothetical protein